MNKILLNEYLKGGLNKNYSTLEYGKEVKNNFKKLILHIKKKYNTNISFKDLDNLKSHILDYMNKNFDEQLMIDMSFYLNSLVKNNEYKEKITLLTRLINYNNFSLGETRDDDKSKIEYLQKSLPELKVYKDCNIKKYLTDSKLGSGAFGSVFSIKNNPDVVVKTIDLRDYVAPKKSDMYGDSLEEIVNEINILKKLKGSKIAPEYYESWICKKNDILFIYIAEERMSMSYGDWLDEGNIINNDVLDKLKTKLDKLHEIGIVHLDFHTGNIMLKINEEKEIEPYINDFGISKFNNQLFDDRKKQDLRAYKRLLENFSKYEVEFLASIITYINLPVII